MVRRTVSKANVGHTGADDAAKKEVIKTRKIGSASLFFFRSPFQMGYLRLKKRKWRLRTLIAFSLFSLWLLKSFNFKPSVQFLLCKFISMACSSSVFL